MTDYTPTTDDVKECYLFGQENTNVTSMKSQREHEAEFDRWLEQHDREVATKAELDLTQLREIAEPPTCPNHREVQHRDRKPPWCPDCGWNRGRPAAPPRQIDARADTEGIDHA